jgi:hypothetical protein
VSAGIFAETQANVQFAVGCSNGVVYLLDSFEYREFFNVGYPITQLISVQSPQPVNWLLCIGHFNAVKIYAGQKVDSV